MFHTTGPSRHLLDKLGNILQAVARGQYLASVQVNMPRTYRLYTKGISYPMQAVCLHCSLQTQDDPRELCPSQMVSRRLTVLTWISDVRKGEKSINPLGRNTANL